MFSDKKLIKLFLFFSLLLSLKNGLSQKKTDSTFTVIPNEYILTFKDDTVKNLIKSFLSLQGVNELDRKALSITFLNGLFPSLNLNKQTFISINQYLLVANLDSITLREAKTDPRFKSIEKNYKIKIPQHLPDTTKVDREQISWGLQRIIRNVRSNIDSRKHVWLVDSGVDPKHEDLNVDISLSRSFVPGAKFSDVSNNDYHGTHLAGIIGAKKNNKGIIGVAPNASIVALKVIQNGEIPQYDYYLTALNYVLNFSSPNDVVNISIEGTPGSQEEINVIKSIGERGVKVVISAGNRQEDIYVYSIYPALINGQNIYVIASCDEKNKFSVFSNYGQSIIYCAPGDKILSTLPNNCYGFDSGTSQSAAFVSGLLMLTDHFNYNGKSHNSIDNKDYLIVHEQ